jgi:hypothetical protein
MLAGAIERLLLRGVATGDFAISDIPLAAGLLTGAHLHLFFTPAVQEMDEESVIETLCAFELRALGVKA